MMAVINVDAALVMYGVDQVMSISLHEVNEHILELNKH